MTSVDWPLVEVAARLLERDEREAVLGDLVEAGEGAWRGLLDVLGLVVRRQMLLWKSWRPWLAAFGLALPSCLLLIGASVSVSSMYQRIIAPRILNGSSPTIHEGLLLLICRVLLLIGWSWTGGFVVGSMSRRTLWVSIASSCLPCLFCLARFQEASLSRLCLFLFLLPAIWGVRQGLRIIRINLALAIVLAVAVTALMILLWSSRGLWTLNWALIWPAWYIVATAQGSGREAGRS